MAETIAAISTAFGEGGIGIIRMSGDDSEAILTSLFVPAAASDKKSLKNRYLTYGHIIDPNDGSVVDEVMAVVMRAPHTYTREDVVEIDCHGSVVSLRKILALCYRMGAVPAERGEFTKRAFLNGRLDLSQAESVIDVIQAKTDSTFDVAMGQLQGAYSAHIKEIRTALMDVLVNMAVNIDYPDEDIEEIVYLDLEKRLSATQLEIEELLSSANTGRIIRDGLKVAIVGRPNVGKSSLMNALLKESRAIVTDIPGTTRDTIEEMISIRNIPVRLTDTAGIRETEDKIEQIGIEKSKSSFNESDLVILMIDSSQALSDDDLELMEAAAGRKTLLLANKVDCHAVVSEDDLKVKMPDATILKTSMKDPASVTQIEDEIERLVYDGNVSQSDSLIVTNARHEQLLREASASIADAATATAMQEALEIIEIDVHEAYDSLGEIIGESVADDIINEVFARFCLGK